MTKLPPLVAIALLTSLPGIGARAQPAAGDPAAGRALAFKICTACHVVSQHQLAPPLLDPPAPSFRTIANRKGTTFDSIRGFVATTHTTLKNTRSMPNPELTDDQTANVAAYLMTMRKQRHPG